MNLRPLIVALGVAFACLDMVSTNPALPRESCQSFDGIASWYGPGFIGRPTASGEIFTSQELTAAHRSLPLGTKVHVTNLTNGRSTVVRINDRGPYIDERIIDLSHAAARQLGFDGLSNVVVSTCWSKQALARR